MAVNIDEFKGLVSQKQGIARSNLFSVTLPSLPGATTRDINLLCKDVNLPGRQLTTYDKMIGTKSEKVVYGSVMEDVSMTFHMMNDYGIKKYFEEWQKRAYDQDTYQIAYKSEYTADITIQQLRSGQSFPVYSTPLGIPRVTTAIQNRLPSVGPIDLAQGEIDIDFFTRGTVVYKCKLIDAFPVTINQVPLTNDLDGLVEFQVQLSYTKWQSEFPQQTSDTLTTAVGTIATSLFN